MTGCLIFQQNKVETIKTPKILQPLSIPRKGWTKVSMDFIIGLPKFELKSVIMVIVDRISKYAHFNALFHSFKSRTIANSILDIVQKLHGTPNIIASDKDPIFTGNVWSKLFSWMGTQLDHSSYYHTQYYVEIEIVDKCLKGHFLCFES